MKLNWLLGAALAAEMSLAKPLAFTADTWDWEPIQWRLEGTTLTGTGSNLTSFAKAAVPAAARVKISARFRADRVAGEDWATAGVSIQDDDQNFWCVSLGRAPRKNGGGHFYELCEMREGCWLSQQNLKCAFSKTGAPWQEGRAYNLALELDPEGITGTIRDEAGTVVYQCRFLFTAKAVTTGSPALHITGGLLGTFEAAEVETADPVAVKPGPALPPYASDSFIPDIKGPATGFFHVQKNPDGRWWVIDPLGRGVVLTGVDHVTFWGHFCEKLGKRPHQEKNKKKYTSKAQWEGETLGRLKAWGFNFLGAGCDRALQHRGLIHTVFLSFGDSLASADEPYYITPNEHRPCSAFPNVFHPDFPAHCRHDARQHCAPNRNDPWLFGYFIDNELAWWGRGAADTGLADAVLKKGPAHTAKLALRDFLAERAHRDLAAFNACWGTELKSFDEFLSLTALPSQTEAQRAAKLDFLQLAAERYFSISAAAIREADPNHLVMGARFAGIGGAHPVVWQVAGKYCDVVTFNCYPWADLNRNTVYMDKSRKSKRAADAFAEVYALVGRPMLITEWSFPALDAGLPSIHGAGQRFKTQAGRVAATSLFARTMLSLPFLIGYDYFMWVDEPALGISAAFPEDSNYGLINEDGVPYPGLTAMFTELQKNLGAWRRRPLPEPKTSCLQRHCLTAAELYDSISTGATGRVSLTYDPQHFRVETPAGLVLAGNLGEPNLVGSITWKGQAYGAYNAMISVAGPRWIDTAHLTDIQAHVEKGRGIVELTGRYAAKDQAFEITHRLTVFPDQPVIGCELVRVVNKNTKPLSLRACYFRLYAPFHEISTKDETVPNLWGGADKAYWRNTADGRFIGFTAPVASEAQIVFWNDETGHPHPDAQFEFAEPLSLAPGATFTPPEPMLLLCRLGVEKTL